MSLAPSSEDTALRTSLCDLHVIRVQFDFRPFDRMSWNRTRPPENYWMHYFAKHTATWIAWYYSCTMQSSAGKHTEFATCVWGGVKLLLTQIASAVHFECGVGNVHGMWVSRIAFWCDWPLRGVFRLVVQILFLMILVLHNPIMKCWPIWICIVLWH